MTIKKLNAGALQLVTFITVVIALLLGCFILLVHTQKQFRVKSYLLTDTIQNADKGISFALKNSSTKQDSVALLLDNGATVKLKTAFWGTFLKVGVSSKFKNFKFKKTALLGSKQPLKQNALYLKEHNKPLVLVGNTKIKGNTFLPKQGVKSGNISGQSYNGHQFVDGVTKTIQQFPKLSFQTRNYIQNIHEFYNSKKDLESFQIKSGSSVSNSFEKPTLFHFSINDIFLDNIRVQGNLVIQSDSKITISDSAILKDIILIAPKIEIADKVKGTFQAFATEHILVGKDCNLSYPSALVLAKNYSKQFEENNIIEIDSGTKLQGNIILLGRKGSKNYNPQIALNTNTIVEGEVYCEQTLELKGKVYGTVFTDAFITRANGSYYQNHLLNAEINSKKLDLEYIGLPITNTEKGVAKWLY